MDDLGLWYRALAEHRLLEPRTTEMMLRMPLTASGGPSHLAMGWIDETVRDGSPKYDRLRGFGATDASAGFGTYMTFYPDEQRKPTVVEQ